MLLFLTLYSLAEIASWLSPPVGRIGWASGATQELMGVMILRYCLLVRPRPHSASARQRFSQPCAGEEWLFCATMATSLQRGRGFGGAQWVLLERCCCRCQACIGFVQSAYLHQASLVTDTMALWLQSATGQSVGIATIYPIEPSHRALSAAKDVGWAGRVKQLPSTILSVVMRHG